MEEVSLRASMLMVLNAVSKRYPMLHHEGMYPDASVVVTPGDWGLALAVLYPHLTWQDSIVQDWRTLSALYAQVIDREAEAFSNWLTYLDPEDLYCVTWGTRPYHWGSSEHKAIVWLQSYYEYFMKTHIYDYQRRLPDPYGPLPDIDPIDPDFPDWLESRLQSRSLIN